MNDRIDGNEGLTAEYAKEERAAENAPSKEETFRYTYSAKEQQEIERIRQKYMPHEESKMDQVRKLDAGVTRKGNSIALAVGILSALILGIGMCLCMVWTEYMIIGIPVGIVGIIGVSLTYPLYLRVVKKERERLAPEILRLTEELMK